MNDDVERLQRELLMADLRLRHKQDIWEHPRNIALLVGVAVALAGLVFGALGYKIGQTPQTIIVHLDAPFTITPK